MQLLLRMILTESKLEYRPTFHLLWHIILTGNLQPDLYLFCLMEISSEIFRVALHGSWDTSLPLHQFQNRILDKM